jgi:hypothetical protein
MSYEIIYGGFNPAWQAGRLERELVNCLAQNLEDQYPTLKKVIAVTSWHEPADLVEDIKNRNPDMTFLCSLTDPLGPIENLVDQIPGRVELVGYTNSDYFYDFWAVACLKFFKTYSAHELEPTKFDYLYLNYNRKPHRHRIELVNLLETSGLVNCGCLSLGNSSYTVNDQHASYKEYGSDDVVGDVGIPNDIYSLGQLEIWNKSFINIVSETQFEFSPNVFLSEKIFKPIIGLRPFIINGSPGIYRLLKRAGFDCFEDLFPVDILSNENFNNGWKFDNHKHIIQALNNLKDTNLLEMYDQLRPRLLYNQKLFYEYASNQSINFKFKI